jgi:hypothetical protein
MWWPRGMDNTFVKGRLGVGSYNDAAKFDNVLVTTGRLYCTEKNQRIGISILVKLSWIFISVAN